MELQISRVQILNELNEKLINMMSFVGFSCHHNSCRGNLINCTLKMLYQHFNHFNNHTKLMCVCKFEVKIQKLICQISISTNKDMNVYVSS